MGACCSSSTPVKPAGEVATISLTSADILAINQAIMNQDLKGATTQLLNLYANKLSYDPASQASIDDKLKELSALLNSVSSAGQIVGSVAGAVAGITKAVGGSSATADTVASVAQTTSTIAGVVSTGAAGAAALVTSFDPSSSPVPVVPAAAREAVSHHSVQDKW